MFFSFCGARCLFWRGNMWVSTRTEECVEVQMCFLLPVWVSRLRQLYCILYLTVYSVRLWPCHGCCERGQGAGTMFLQAWRAIFWRLSGRGTCQWKQSSWACGKSCRHGTWGAQQSSCSRGDPSSKGGQWWERRRPLEQASRPFKIVVGTQLQENISESICTFQLEVAEAVGGQAVRPVLACRCPAYQKWPWRWLSWWSWFLPCQNHLIVEVVLMFNCLIFMIFIGVVFHDNW